ncbi:MAG TPA: serine/threonine-protein kinase, partial [Kofleriaceae bacterium]|nr:serine/threonine-protein kinase [Kofleriaceae bacterium]
EQLENRVADQVVEILRGERQVATLSVQLQDQVKQRSHELADAIKQVMLRRDDAPLRAGDVVGERARIVAPLGAGGMGRVYLADDLLTGQKVAVKLLRGHIAADGEALGRFVAEAAAAAEVSHPGIIRTFHVDVDAAGHLYQVMEHVPGVTLAARAVRGPLPAGETARIGAVIADALAAAHDAGVIHRDIKPANLILCATEPGVRILDFGLSKLIDEAPASASGLTLPQRVVGTPRYMSPEQIQDPGAVAAPSDVYSLGLVLYELLAGRSPYTATTPAEYCLAHIQATPLPLADAAADVPAPLTELVHQCLSKDPGTRPTAAALAATLRTLADTLSAPPIPTTVRRELDAATQATTAAATSSPSS